ncbi:MAG: hypothetical protein FIA94_13665 [Nitrospirae bacterium]|nr:hypothetical protein [Nitrospirota bacterium]
MNANTLITFYQGKGSDAAGRMIEEIWAWDHHKLEWTHDYIQWLFPLKEKSRFNPDAPVLNAGSIYHFRQYLQQQVLRSFKLMLSCYGLRPVEKSGASVQIVKGNNFKDRSLFWISEGNHNYLRISRILQSLVLVGLAEHARAFFDCLRKIYQEEKEEIGEETLSYWKAATIRKPNKIKQLFDEHFQNALTTS